VLEKVSENEKVSGLFVISFWLLHLVDDHKINLTPFQTPFHEINLTPFQTN